MKAISGAVTYGWGMIPVYAQIGRTRWYTARWPKDGRYILPLKARIRKAETLAEGDEITVHLQVG